MSIVTVLAGEVERLKRRLADRNRRLSEARKSRNHWKAIAKARRHRIYELERRTALWKHRAGAK